MPRLSPDTTGNASTRVAPSLSAGRRPPAPSQLGTTPAWVPRVVGRASCEVRPGGRRRRRGMPGHGGVTRGDSAGAGPPGSAGPPGPGRAGGAEETNVPAAQAEKPLPRLLPRGTASLARWLRAGAGRRARPVARPGPLSPASGQQPTPRRRSLGPPCLAYGSRPPPSPLSTGAASSVYSPRMRRDGRLPGCHCAGASCHAPALGVLNRARAVLVGRATRCKCGLLCLEMFLREAGLVVRGFFAS